MEMFKQYLFILLVIHIHDPSCAVRDAYDAAKELWKLYLMINNMNFNATHNINGFLRDHNVTYQEIRTQMHEIHKKFDEMDKFMNLTKICGPFELFDSSVYVTIITLEIFIVNIHGYYEKFYQFMDESDFYPYPLPNRVVTVLTVEEEIRMIRNIIGSSEPSNAKALLPKITSFVTTHQTQLCGMPQTISNTLVKLFRMVIIAEIKANIILAYARIQNTDDTVGWINLYTRDQFKIYFEMYVNLFAFATRTVDEVYLRSCEPNGGIWIRNENFYELEGTFQTTIFRYSWMNCKFDNCNNVWFEKPSECHAGYYDDRSGCSGIPAQCAYLNAIQACVLKTGPYKFQYVNSTAIGLLGRNFECPKDNGYIIEDGGGWNFTTGVCTCNCYRNHNKISLLLMESRQSANMVIIGLRFVRKDGILHIQPKEGKLGPHGYIHRYSERWRPIPNNTKTFQTHSIDREHRVFFLDDVHLDPGYILTGVKFNKVTRGTVTGFAIQIFGVPFDYESGQLQLASVFEISKQASNKNSGQPLSFKAISSLHTRLPLTLSPSIKKYVSLERSELSDDFGQSTLPFFDAVAITTRSSSPLSGIGIFHKGTEGYAGFISLRVYGIKYAQYFTDVEFSNVV